MSTLLVGSNSDIAKKLVQINEKQDFIELTSSPSASYQHKIDLQDVSTYPSIDKELSGFVYFPGSINLRPFSNLKEVDYENDYNINVLGLLKTLKHYHKQFSNKASVVMISSVAAQVGMPFHSSISMCKSAIEGLTRSLAAEWSPKIRVNCVAPSIVDTKLSSRLLRTEKQVDQINERHPLKRHGKVSDIAETIDFLLSEKSSWMTGQVLKVDGGMSTIKKINFVPLFLEV